MQIETGNPFTHRNVKTENKKIPSHRQRRRVARSLGLPVGVRTGPGPCRPQACSVLMRLHVQEVSWGKQSRTRTSHQRTRTFTAVVFVVLRNWARLKGEAGNVAQRPPPEITSKGKVSWKNGPSITCAHLRRLKLTRDAYLFTCDATRSCKHRLK